MANKRIKDIGTTATSLASDDFVAVDGSSQGTRKIQKANLVNDISSEIAGTYLDESNNLSDVASKDTSKLNLEVPNVGVSPNEVPLSGQLGTMAFQDSAGVSVEQLEVTDKIDGSVEIADEDNCTLTLRSDSDNNSGSRNTQIQFQIDAGTTKGLVSYDQDADVMQMSYGGNNKHLVVDSSGNVGISNTSPGRELTIGDGTGSPNIQLLSSNAGNARIEFGDTDDGDAGEIQYLHDSNAMQITTNGAERVRIDSSGRVGQSGVTPGSYHANADNLVLANEGLGGDTGLTIRSGTSGTGAIHFADGTSGTDRYRGYISYTQSSDTLNFATSGTTRWSIGSGGVLLGAAGNGIRFDTGTTLDSYEEGSFTPVIGTSGGTINGTTTINSARYTKIGNTVHIAMYVATDGLTDISSASGYVRITGLPFAAAGSNHYGGLVATYATNWSAAPVGGYVGTNSTIVAITKRFSSITGNVSTGSVSDLNTSGGTKNDIILTGHYEAA